MLNFIKQCVRMGNKLSLQEKNMINSEESVNNVMNDVREQLGAIANVALELQRKISLWDKTEATKPSVIGRWLARKGPDDVQAPAPFQTPVSGSTVTKNITSPTKVRGYNLIPLLPVPELCADAPEILAKAFNRERLIKAWKKANNSTDPRVRNKWNSIAQLTLIYMKGGRTIQSVGRELNLTDYQCYNQRAVGFDNHAYGKVIKTFPYSSRPSGKPQIKKPKPLRTVEWWSK
jgi:hypothetical protein